MDECLHAHVDLADKAEDSDGPMWVCRDCGIEFTPVYVLEEAVDAAVNSAVTVATALLWNFHERALKTHGHGVIAADEDASDVKGRGPGLYEHAFDDGHEHVFKDGACTLCGTSVFL